MLVYRIYRVFNGCPLATKQCRSNADLLSAINCMHFGKQLQLLIARVSNLDFLLHKWHSANSLERKSFCIQYLLMQTAIVHVCFTVHWQMLPVSPHCTYVMYQQCRHQACGIASVVTNLSTCLHETYQGPPFSLQIKLKRKLQLLLHCAAMVQIWSIVVVVVVAACLLHLVPSSIRAQVH